MMIIPEDGTSQHTSLAGAVNTDDHEPLLNTLPFYIPSSEQPAERHPVRHGAEQHPVTEGVSNLIAGVVPQWYTDDRLPDFTFLSLVDDHTGGVPTPTAQVADNDLAVGRLISEISHSKVWKDSAIFVEEDDTSSGADHVDGHRGPLYIASPYATHGVVNSDYYTTINVDKTIEQILGAQPLNQYDRAAVPMFDAFTDKPDYTPYRRAPEPGSAHPGRHQPHPTDTGRQYHGRQDGQTPVTATSGPPAPAVPAAEQPIASAWATWDKTTARPTLSGPHAARDSVNPAQLNRYDWYTSTDWSQPYPGDKSILAPDQVPGRNVPTEMTGDN